MTTPDDPYDTRPAVQAFLRELLTAMHGQAPAPDPELTRALAERDALREVVNAYAQQPTRFKRAIRRTFRQQEAS